ncbi:MAG TPA: phosphatase PAP2 family protein, partial [Streptosporangiaceae bacterium]|nr:phosphatase PAP2 family protein [Streptosporangiaceae bacterium]
MDVPAKPPARAAAARGPHEQAGIRRSPRRRRPSGQPPPLPRHLQSTGVGWLAAAVVLLVVSVVVFAGGLRGPAVAVTVADDAVVRWLAGLRVPGLLPAMRALAALGSWVAISALLYGLLAALLILRRLRQLLIVLAAWIMQGVIIQYIAAPLAQRPRPFGVVFRTGWDAWALPSEKMAALAVALLGILYALVPEGRWRQRGKWAAAAVVLLVAIAHLYLGVLAPTDVLVGVAVGVAIPLAGFRLFAPGEVFPVTYRRGSTAHLDVGGARGKAIRRALQDQLGLVAGDVEPFGLAGSAGSTPLRIKLKGDPGTDLFGKLYARSHLRSDRWYKLGRELLYGRLEDEKPFHTVRRLVQQEDYALRVLRDAGLPTPAPYGFVELTPEREYLLVTEFFDGATELGDAEIGDPVIDDGLRVIRKLWDAGLAHRDIKPANLLVRNDQLLLIDVAFAEARPTPWRQAVDLANMMLCLALRSRAELVYRRALRQFTVEEITEAFAAARGLALPSQLRRMLREQGRDLHGEFVRLLPERPRPIRIQRWSARRAGLLLLVTALAALLVPAAQYVLANDYQHTAPLNIESLRCGEPEPLWLLAQSVPSASLVPCVRTLPAGWTVATAKAKNGLSEFTLAHDPDSQAVVVRLTAACTTSGAAQRPSGQPGVRRYERPDATGSGQIIWYTVFTGGCVTAQLHPAGNTTVFADQASSVLDLTTRRSLQQA